MIRLVAGREVRERMRSKSYWVLTGLLVVIVLAIGVIGRIASAPSTEVVGVTGAPAGLATALARVGDQLGVDVSVREFDDARAASAAVRAGRVAAAVDGGRGELRFAEEPDDGLAGIVQQAWALARAGEELTGAGLDETAASRVLSPQPLEVMSLDGSPATPPIAYLAGSLTTVLLFVSLQTFGNYVLVGVVEEKSTGVVELLLARARADQLLAGKVIGIGIAAIVQFLAAVAAGVAAMAISGVEVPTDLWSAVPVSLVWFAGGYALYSMLFALAGSLVSRQEDASAAATPILTVLILAYVLVFSFGYVPRSTASTVMSLIPPIAPLLMPMRMAAGAASAVEVVVAAVLLVVTIAGSWKVSARVYEEVLLRRGSRIGWREALRRTPSR